MGKLISWSCAEKVESAKEKTRALHKNEHHFIGVSDYSALRDVAWLM